MDRVTMPPALAYIAFALDVCVEISLMENQILYARNGAAARTARDNFQVA
jgi:hypothetical protein